MTIGWWVKLEPEVYPGVYKRRFYGVKVSMRACGEITQIHTTNGGLFEENFAGPLL